MRQFYKLLIIVLCFFSLNDAVFADPWFTGPILAPAGHTVARGHTNVEIYAIGANVNGRYNDFGQFIGTPHFTSNIINPIITHGFTDWLDIQVAAPYVFNGTQGKHYHRLADASAALGIQVLEQKKSWWRPDLRFVVQEIFPTGKYEYLNPAFLGTDSTGYGAYETQIALNFQWLMQVFQTHYLRTRLSLSQLYSSQVDVNGFNTYGGDATTQGNVDADVENMLDIAFEYTLTQNWVAVFEAYFSDGGATRFNGIASVGSVNGTAAAIGSASFIDDGLAPAIEYNFNENVGVIGGVIFPIKGKNTNSFTTLVLALNAYW